MISAAIRSMREGFDVYGLTDANDSTLDANKYDVKRTQQVEVIPIGLESPFQNGYKKMNQ
jgi:hypothetical protein